jgi:hypothetical protein
MAIETVIPILAHRYIATDGRASIVGASVRLGA